MPGGGGGGGIPALSAYAPNMLYCRLYLIYIYIYIFNSRGMIAIPLLDNIWQLLYEQGFFRTRILPKGSVKEH